MSESPQSFNLEGRNAFAPIMWLRDWAGLTVEGWRERSRLRRELNDLDQRGELGRTLQDTGLTRSDVSRLMRAHPHTPQQLAKMMQLLGMSRSAVLSRPSGVEALRAMEWRCGECKNWRKCRAWLASGQGPESYRAFCPNAAALDDLRCSESADSSVSTQKRGVLMELRSEEGIEIAHA
jgi:uncharacterized protein YjiS (DUF1127 family)